MLSACMALIDEPSDKEKFEEIYSSYKDIMYETAVSVIKDETEAEDIVQDSFLKIAKNISKFSEAVSSKTASFILIIVRNTAYDYLRKGKHIETIPYDDNINISDEIFMPEFEKVLSDSGMGNVMDMISDIDKIYSDVLKLKYIYGCTNSEIGQLFDISLKNVEMRIYRTKLMLKEKMEGNGYAVE